MHPLGLFLQFLEEKISIYHSRRTPQICIIMAELLYVISSQLTKFIRADKFLLFMPLQHKFANR